MRIVVCSLMQSWLLAATGLAAGLDVVTTDPGKQAIPGVEIRLNIGADLLYSAHTGTDGRAHFQNLKPAHYDLTAIKEGLETVHKSDLDLSGEATIAVDLTLVPALARSDSIEVKASSTPIQQAPSSANQLPTQGVKELPGRPATVTDALPLVPGVVRRPGGGLVISATGEHRSALVVNSADVTDPATGQFGLTVPIDVVETLNVYQTPFLAEYGRFTAGVVSVETRRGGDKWKWELNDPFPDFRIRSYHLRGLRDATPRINLEGPLIEGKLYLSEGTDYEIRKTAVYELPFPHNQKKQAGFNSFAQLDWIASSRQLVTATFHVAPQRLDFTNLDFFNPEPTTPEARTQNYTATLADKLTIFGGVLENTLSFTRFDARVWGQGQQDFTMAPQGNSGNYFAQQDRRASRFSLAPTFSSATVQWLGTHSFKSGGSVAHSGDVGQVVERPIDLLDANGLLFERIAFSDSRQFRMHDLEGAVFGQDHWLISPKLAVDLGIRAESQEISESFRVAPRGGIAWTPFARTGTVIRAGYGLFYDRLPLNVYSFDHYPTQTVQFFDGNGQAAAGPFVYQNLLGTLNTRIPFVFREQSAQRQRQPPGGTDGVLTSEAASWIHAKPVGRPSGRKPHRSGSGYRFGDELTHGRWPIPLSPVRGHRACSLERQAAAILFLRPQPGTRRPKRFFDLSGHLRPTCAARQPVRQSAGRSAQSFSGVGAGAITVRIPCGSAYRIPQRLSLHLGGRGSELGGGPQC
jgi:hypothetical protein